MLLIFSGLSEARLGLDDNETITVVLLLVLMIRRPFTVVLLVGYGGSVWYLKFCNEDFRQLTLPVCSLTDSYTLLTRLQIVTDGSTILLLLDLWKHFSKHPVVV